MNFKISKIDHLNSLVKESTPTQGLLFKPTSDVVRLVPQSSRYLEQFAMDSPICGKASSVNCNWLLYLMKVNKEL